MGKSEASPLHGDDSHRKFLKKLVIVAALIAVYSLAGATLFYALEAPAQQQRLDHQSARLLAEQSNFINHILGLIKAVNDLNESVIVQRMIAVNHPKQLLKSEVLQFFTAQDNSTDNSTDNITDDSVMQEQYFIVIDKEERKLDDYLMEETSKLVAKAINIRGCEEELEWDFANAMLYVWTLITTIG